MLCSEQCGSDKADDISLNRLTSATARVMSAASAKAWGQLRGSGRADDFNNGLAGSGLTVKRVGSLCRFIGCGFEGLNPQLVYCFLFQLKIRILKPWWCGDGGGTSRVVELRRWRWISSEDRDGEGSS